MTRFRIFHFSDFHFSTPPSRQNWRRLFRQSPAISLDHLISSTLIGFPASYSQDLAEHAARVAFEWRDNFDAILLTGDLATTANIEYLKTARSYIAAAASSGYLSAAGDATLQAANKPVLLMPGNHDRFRDILGRSASPNFDLIFEGRWASPVSKCVLEKDGEVLAIVAADFCLKQDGDAEPIIVVNRPGRGRVYEDVLGALQTTTDAIRAKYGKIAVVWAVHFPPSENCPSVLRLVRSELLEDAAKDKSIQLLFAGHLHRNVEHRTRHGAPILCAGTLTSSGGDGSNWLHLIEIGISKGQIKNCEKIDFRWDDEQGDFMDSDSTEVAMQVLV